MTMPTWVTIAQGELGQTEIAGPEHNARIIEYHSQTTLRASQDEVPWCAAFVSWCLGEAGIPNPRSARARDFEHWGRDVTADPPVGAIAVFWRGSRSAGTGHVGIFMGRTPDGKLRILGGNQGNAVNVRSYDTGKLLSLRWPSDVPLPIEAKPIAESRTAAAGAGVAVAGAGGLVAAGAEILPSLSDAGFNPWQIILVVALAGALLLGLFVIRRRFADKKKAASGLAGARRPLPKTGPVPAAVLAASNGDDAGAD